MSLDPAQLTDRYEQLRAAALAGQPGGHGMAVLQRRGTPAWMGAWEALRPPMPHAPVTAAGPLAVPANAEVALVLTNMVLAAVGR